MSSGRERLDTSPAEVRSVVDASERPEYSAPTLTRWGTVRDLTRGDAGGFLDFPGTRKDT